MAPSLLANPSDSRLIISKLPPIFSSQLAASSSALHGAEVKPVVSSEPGSLPSIISMSSEPVVLEKFTLFPKLPNELRDMVWVYSMANQLPRIVEVEYCRTEQNILATTLPPPLLHVCRGSRKVALTQYEALSFSKFSGAYINWKRDIIMLNITDAIFFYQELDKVNCADLYQKCTRLVINAGTTTNRSFLEAGDFARGDEEWIEDSVTPENGHFVEELLFGYFEVLQEVSVHYLGMMRKGDGNLTIEMASDGIPLFGSAPPRKGSARYELTEFGYTFPSQNQLDLSNYTINTIRAVKLVRGTERRMTRAAKMEKCYVAQLKKVKAFRGAKMVMDDKYEVDAGEAGDEEWEGKIETWVDDIPAGPASWPEDWARALSDFWA